MAIYSIRFSVKSLSVLCDGTSILSDRVTGATRSSSPGCCTVCTRPAPLRATAPAPPDPSSSPTSTPWSTGSRATREQARHLMIRRQYTNNQTTFVQLKIYIIDLLIFEIIYLTPK